VNKKELLACFRGVEAMAWKGRRELGGEKKRPDLGFLKVFIKL
jgi:hypothetical protein